MFTPENFSFTTTAISRPEIIEQTYASFNTGLIGINLKEFKLHINIDPIPNHENTWRVLDIACKYFGSVHANISADPNFTKAVNWCWSNADTEYVFHLEDDWILIEHIDMMHVYRELSSNDEYMECIFRAYLNNYGNNLALSPSVWKRECYSKFAGNLNPNVNPEVQLRNKNIIRVAKNGVFVLGSDRVIVRDIGRKWVKEHKYCKIGVKSNFITYQQFVKNA